MSEAQKAVVKVQGTNIAVLARHRQNQDFISLTDIAKHKEPDRSDHVIQNWMRNRNTVEFLGTWERLNNPDFKPLEFEGFRNKAGLNSFANEADVLNVALFGQTAKEWRMANPSLDGNMRDHATVEQLLVLANIEGMNAELIHMGLAQGDRLRRLNAIAIRQMQVLTTAPAARQLKGQADA